VADDVDFPILIEGLAHNGQDVVLDELDLIIEHGLGEGLRLEGHVEPKRMDLEVSAVAWPSFETVDPQIESIKVGEVLDISEVVGVVLDSVHDNWELLEASLVTIDNKNHHFLLVWVLLQVHIRKPSLLHCFLLVVKQVECSIPECFKLSILILVLEGLSV